jgi:hypothetical protein
MDKPSPLKLLVQPHRSQQHAAPSAARTIIAQKRIVRIPKPQKYYERAGCETIIDNTLRPARKSQIVL